MKVLISGAGIAGPTLAYWLHRYGLEPTIVERSSQLRRGGYIIDFWGVGFDVAERMELLAEIRREGYLVREVRVVGRNGNRVAGFPVDSVARIANGRYISIPRGELAALIYRTIEGNVETIFNDSIASIDETSSGVRVSLTSGTVRDFDLVIGADGLHSRVREVVFGPEIEFERYLGYKVAAFEASGYGPRDDLVYVMHTEVGQQVGRFTLRGDRTLFFFIFAETSRATPDAVGAQKRLLRQRFGNSGWECPQILSALDSAKDLYFDRVSQIRMKSEGGLSWTRERISLVGDAAWCVSLLAGQGSAIAMAGAYILAAELHRAGGDYRTAFSRYENQFADFVMKKQQGALKFAGTFAPTSRLSMRVRNSIMNLLRIPWIADFVLSRDLGDKLKLPEY